MDVNRTVLRLDPNDCVYTTINGNGALDLYDPVAHTGELTDQYLKDRADFVLAKLKANTDDASVTVRGRNIGHEVAWAKQNGEEVIYLDKVSSPGNVFPGYSTAEIYQGNNTAGILGTTYSLFEDIKQIQFGSLLSDTLTGGNKADSLYGMGGDDVLIGCVFAILFRRDKCEAANNPEYAQQRGCERKVA